VTVAPGTSRIQRFGVFEYDPAAGELRKQGRKLKLQGQPIEILGLLLERPGEVITREELQKKLWLADTFVDFEHSLNAAVKRLRDAIDDSAETPRYIETLPRRGYRFLVPVEVLAPSPARPSTVRWLGLGGASALLLLAVLLGLNAGGLRDRFLGRGGPAKKVMLAVLPFENLSNDSAQEYFSDGMTDEMITQLGRLQPDRLGVIARGSVMRYKHSDQAAGRVAQELGVQYILEGSVRREGQKVRISAQLIQTSDQAHLWAQNYDGDLSGILALQTRVARDAASEIRIKLAPTASAAAPATRSVDPEAYQFCLRARYNLNRIWHKGGHDRLKAALDLFQQAVAKDSSYAPAFAGLAEAHMWAVHIGLDAPALESEASARSAAEKALQLDSSSADAHIAMALYLESQWDFSAMDREAKTAIELDPNSSWDHQLYGLMLIHEGRLDHAFSQMQVAAAMDPFSSASLIFLAHYYGATRNWDQVIETSKAAIKLDPDFLLSYNTLAEAYERKDMIVESLQAVSEGAQRAGADMAQLKKDLEPYRKAFDAGGASAYQKKKIQLAWLDVNRSSPPDPIGAARLCAQDGQIDKAFTSLELAFQKHEFGMIFLSLMPDLDPLHSDPRWNDLRRRMNFPPDPVKQ
jgi:TolB-like protein/DNA-binding winged helix-turn-helix (wHTH) protein/Tfp pilus assembly protein PilF